MISSKSIPKNSFRYASFTEPTDIEKEWDIGYAY